MPRWCASGPSATHCARAAPVAEIEVTEEALPLPKGERQPSPMVVNFYDLENSAWRSLSIGAPVFE